MKAATLAIAFVTLLAGSVHAKPKAPLPPEQLVAKKRLESLTQGHASPPPDEGGAVELRLRKIIPVGEWPKGVELTPDQKEAWATNFASNSISVIDAGTLQVTKTIRTGESSPVEAAWFPDRMHALVTGGYEKSDLLILDLKRHTVVKRLEGKVHGKRGERRSFPKVAAFSKDGERFYISYWDTNNIGVFDAWNFELLGLVPAGMNPRGIALTPDGRKGYACNFDSKGNSITVFQADAPPFAVLKTIQPLPNPRHLAMSSDGRFAYASLFGAQGGLVKIDTVTDEVVARSASTGRYGKTVKLSPDGRWVFLANFGADTVSVFDAHSLAEVTRVATGREPCGLDVSRDGTTLWTTDWKDNQVRVFDIVVRAPIVVAQAGHTAVAPTHAPWSPAE